MKKIILALLSLIQTVFTLGIKPINDSLRIVRPLQFSIITPLGTNGLESGKITNHISINLIFGYAGGVEGVEMGAFSNYLKGDMSGVQLAGFGNYVNGMLSGSQFSGFYNCARKYSKGIQCGGFINMALDSSELVQASGFLNLARGNAQGAQIAGFGNSSHSGLNGVQISGFGNFAGDSVNGIQIAGFANITTREIKGIQLSGFFNYAKKVNGGQIGFINVSDSIEKGIPIGFLSFVRHGYNKVEFESGLVHHFSTNVKLGSSRFYNILSSGINLKGANNIYWGIGYGIGTFVGLSNSLGLNFDGISYHLNEGEWFTDKLNFLNRLKINLSFKALNKLTIYGGPTLDVWVSQIKNSEGKLEGSKISPKTIFYQKSTKYTLVKIAPSFNLGLRL